jgi:hypothetical protein
MAAERINTAAQTLLAACFDGADPVERLYAELERLRASGNWTAIELRRIQELALSSARAVAANLQVHGRQPPISRPVHRSLNNQNR